MRHRCRWVAALRELERTQPKIRGRKIEVVEGDFNRKVSEILSSGRIRPKTATFCLLDQRTFECDWRTVERLARHKGKEELKIELFYFLATGWLDRSIAGTKDEERLRRWWGRDDWRSLSSLKSWDKAMLLCDRFKSELGYVYAQPYPIYAKEVGGRIMYHMVHASDHDKAPGFMNRAYLTANQQRESLKLLQRSFEQMGIVLPDQRKPTKR